MPRVREPVTAELDFVAKYLYQVLAYGSQHMSVDDMGPLQFYMSHEPAKQQKGRPARVEIYLEFNGNSYTVTLSRRNNRGILTIMTC